MWDLFLEHDKISRDREAESNSKKKSLKAAEAYTKEKQQQRRHYWDEIKAVEAKNARISG